MAGIMQAVGPCRLRSEAAHSPFASLARAIAYQQLNGTAAGRIFGRFVALYAPAPFPPPEAVLRTADEVLRGVGFSYAKVRALRDLAEKTAAGLLEFDRMPEMSEQEVIAHLTQVKGIGVWTAHMFLMFTLRRPDILPVGDYGIQAAIKKHYKKRKWPKPAVMEKIAKPWAPHRSIACWYLWRSLDIKTPEK